MSTYTILPPDILPEYPEQIELVDDQTLVFEPQFSRRYVQRNSYGDPRWRIRRKYSAMRASDRSRLMTAIAEARGAYNIVYVSPAQSISGSFPVGELLANADFSQGIANWNATDTTQLTAANGRLRATRKKGALPVTEVYQGAGTGTMVQYAPYVMRALHDRSRWVEGSYAGCYHNDGTLSAYDYPTTQRMTKAVLVPAAASAFGIVYPVVSYNVGVAPDSYIDVLFTSRSRCFLVDNGPNYYTQSADLSHANWTKFNTTVAGSEIAPNGENTAYGLTPNTSDALHYIYQSHTVTSTEATYTLTGAFKSNGYNFVWLQMNHASGVLYQIFNLAAGTLATTANTGSGWNYRRAYISPLGDGWYQCSVTAYKTSTDTLIHGVIAVANADSTATYAGNGSSGIRAWRPSIAASDVPMRLTATQSVAAPTGTSQSGSSIHVKGLPASTNGLLLPGDWVEINGQLKMVTAPLNSDTLGLGVLSFRPALHRPVADNDPIIVTKPLGKFLLRNGAQWENRYGQYADIDLVLDEVYE